jgi:hypothetical protein
MTSGAVLLSACAFGLAAVLTPPAAAALAAIGLVLLVISFSKRYQALTRGLSDLERAAAVAMVALTAVLVPWGLVGTTPRWVAAALPLTALLLTLAMGTRGATPERTLVAGVIVIAIGAVTGAWLITGARDVGIDVVWLHEAAARALASGANIYGPAVTVPNGAPGALPGAQIVGYPYPPVDALAYAASTWLFGDPRWLNLAAWIALALCTLALALRSRHWRSVLPLLLLASLPASAAMLQSAWTEMLPAALFGVAAVCWAQPIASGLALGLALGAKQYFVVILPLLLLARNSKARGTAAALTAAATLLPAFVTSPSEAWRSLVLSHADTLPRTDSGNLVGVLATFGVRWDPPVSIAIIPALAMLAVLARRIMSPSDFLRALAAGLAVFFLLSSQAMANYWYLVAVIAILGCVGDVMQEFARPGHHATD